MSASAPRPPRRLDGPIEWLLLACAPWRGARAEGRRDGLWVQALPGGRPLRERRYRAGVRDGRASAWYLHGGRRYLGEWRDGEKTGEWYYFRRDGRIDVRRTGKYERGLRYATLPGFNDLRR